MALQNRKSTWHQLGVMIAVFVIINAALVLGKNYLLGRGIDFNMIAVGNIILFAIGAFTMSRSLKAVNDPNPHVFVRSFYAGFLIRLAVIAVAAFFYFYSKDGKVEKTGLFACLGIYAVYSVVEVSTLRKALREKSNA